MTNHQEDAELRSLLHGDIQSDLGFADVREWGPEGQKNYESMLDTVMQRIKTHSEKVALEARIDELKNLPVNWEACYDSNLRKRYSKVYDDVYDKRLAELQSQLNNQDKETEK